MCILMYDVDEDSYIEEREKSEAKITKSNVAHPLLHIHTYIVLYRKFVLVLKLSSVPDKVVQFEDNGDSRK